MGRIGGKSLTIQIGLAIIRRGRPMEDDSSSRAVLPGAHVGESLP